MQLSHLLAMAALLAAQGGNDASQPDTARPTNAQVVLIEEVHVPAEQTGVLRALQLADGTRVEAGVPVSEGAVLGALDNRDALARAKAAELDRQMALAEALKSEVAITAAEATVEVALAEVDESITINERARNLVPATQLRRQELTAKRAQAEADVAKSDAATASLAVQLRAAQLEIAQLNLDRHTIRSPLQGQVAKVFLHVGEWVNPGDQILRIIRLDRLRVKGYLDVNQYPREAVIGQPVTVIVRIGERTEVFPDGKVTYASPEILGTDYEVWCDLDNRKRGDDWILLPGRQVEMSILLKGS